jgi:glycine cleavage system H lipoate-binding protein
VTLCCRLQVDGKALKDVQDNGGKMKKNSGLWVKADTTICELKVPGLDGDVVCKAGVKGKFLAANKALCQDTSILTKRPHDEGFLCILCLYSVDRDKALKQLLTREQYCSLRGIAVEALR